MNDKSVSPNSNINNNGSVSSGGGSGGFVNMSNAGVRKGLENFAGGVESAGGPTYLEGGEHVYEGLKIDAHGEKGHGGDESVHHVAAVDEGLESARSMEIEGGVEEALPPEVLPSIEKDKGELDGPKGTPGAEGERKENEEGIKSAGTLDERVVDVRHGGASTYNVSSEADGTTKAADAMEADFIEGVNEAHGDSTNK